MNATTPLITEPLVQCRGLVRSFGRLRALDDVSIDIRAGEFFTLLGPSGCGKTTLLRTIAGFETQDQGSIRLGGVVLDGLPPFRRPVNTVFQSYAIFPHLTVAQNVAFGLEMQRMPPAAIKARVAEMLALVRLTGREDYRAAQLSGGQLQRVALARALATQPKVLLLDEPLSALDAKLRTGMQIELKRLQAEVGITFLLVTHDQHEAMTMSDRIAVMSAGQVLQVGTPTEIYERPQSRFVADFIGAANLLDAVRAGPCRFALPDGTTLRSAVSGPDGPVALAIRPERVRIVGGGMQGTVQLAVYDGAGTTYHVALPCGTVLRVRAGNGAVQAQLGDMVGLDIPPDAVWPVPT